MINDKKRERAKLAMDRYVMFWKRQMPDQILVQFLYSPKKMHDTISSKIPEFSNDLEKEYEKTYEHPEKMLKIMEDMIIKNRDNPRVVYDDSHGLHEEMPDLQFGNGLPGAMFGAKLHHHNTKEQTYTFNDPVVLDWEDLDRIKFDESNYWVKKCLDYFEYYVKNSTVPYVIKPLGAYEGANFIVSMRGTTQAFFDLADQPPGLRKLYELGVSSAARFFELRRDVIKDHNEKMLDHKEYSSMAPYHAVPWVDTDAYALCSPKVFEEIGFEYKQKILDYFKGGEMYIHGLGHHIIPAAGRLDNLTQLSLYDDPGCPRAFDRRERIRDLTYDIPLMIDCRIEELLEGMSRRSLPGGVKYNVFMSEILSDGELNRIMEKVKKYRAPIIMCGKPKQQNV